MTEGGRPKGIDSSCWSELSPLLDEALDLPEGERTRWLASLGAEHDALKPRLINMLAGRRRLGQGFIRTLPKIAPHPADSPPEDMAGAQIGPYRLVRLLAEGGMGVVWLAERDDWMIHRPVALKLPHGNWQRESLADRLEREREILATLNHPNIARLYDAGLTPDGRPYLVLEYVEGRHIDTYCEEQALDLPARLRLFLQVASAVTSAHGQLVVHRDLKPPNILVSHSGGVKLLDFGIAKLLEQAETREKRLTRLMERPG